MRFGWTLFGLAAGLGLFCGTAEAQRQPYQPVSRTPPAATASPAAVPTAVPTEIHVDRRCRILPASPTLSAGKRAKPWSDWNACHLESVFDTEHRVQTVVGSELQRSDVEIREQQYVLGNQSQQPEVFIIEQPALKGWTIEGDPPPFRVADGKEYYRAWVQPGETVRLHVGMRKVTPLKPRALKVAAQHPAPAAASSLPAGAPMEPPQALPAHAGVEQLLSAPCPILSGQPQVSQLGTARAGDIVHMAVFLQNQAGQPEHLFSAHDFSATYQGSSIPIQLIRPRLGNGLPKGRYEPTNLLVLLAPLPDPSDQEFRDLLGSLGPIWQRGWRVAVGWADGNVTAYASSSADLQKMWQGPQVACRNIPVQTAIRDLKALHGRGVVVYLAGGAAGHAVTPSDLQNAVADAGAEMFVVDGGEATEPVASVGAFQSSPSPGGSYGSELAEESIDGAMGGPTVEVQGLGRRATFSDREWHEVDVRHAIGAALEGGRGFYDLRMKLPSSVVSAAAPETLSLSVESNERLLVTGRTWSRGVLPVVRIQEKFVP
jgi:hypothetical protein